MTYAPKHILISVVFATLVLGATARAEMRVQADRVELTTPYAEKIVELAVTEDTCIAISERLHLAAVGRKNGDAAQIVFYPLDEHGELAEAQPVTLDIPVPAACKDCFIYLTAIVFHPDKPLLYVWRDMRGKRNDYPSNEFVFEHFSHLLIYRWEDGAARLECETAKGGDFAFGVLTGALALSPSTDRLFVPNVQRPNPEFENRFIKMVGYYELDENGMPGKRVNLPTKPRYPEHSLNPLGNYNNFPFGQGNFLVLDEKTIAYSDKHDVVILHLDEDYRSPLYEQRFAGWEPFYIVMMDCTANPEKPVLYIASDHQIVRLMHAAGYFTLLPRQITLPSNPYAVESVGSGQIAVGTENGILFLHTDDEGTPTGAYERLPAIGYVQSIAYSRQFDRLYAVVDRLSEKTDGQ